MCPKMHLYVSDVLIEVRLYVLIVEDAHTLELWVVWEQFDNVRQHPNHLMSGVLQRGK